MATTSRLYAANGRYGHSGNNDYTNSAANHLFVGKSNSTSNYRSRLTFAPISSIAEVGDNVIRISEVKLYLRRNDGGPTTVTAGSSNYSAWGSSRAGTGSEYIEATTGWHVINITNCASAIEKYASSWYIHLTGNTSNRIRFDGTGSSYKPYITVTWEYVAATIKSNLPDGVTLGNPVIFSIEANEQFPDVENEIHTLEYSIGDVSGVVAENKGTEIEWDTSSIATSIAAEIPDSNTGTVTITMSAFDSDGNLIRTEKYYQTVIVPDTMKPDVDSVGVTINNPFSYGDDKYCLTGESYLSLHPTIDMSSAGGSEIKSVIATVSNGGSVQTLSWDSFVVDESDSNKFSCDQVLSTHVLSNAGDVNVTITVIDSRGHETSKTETYTVCQYSRPTISNFSVERYERLINDNEEEGDPQVSDLGDKVWVNLSADVSAVSPSNTHLNFIKWEIFAQDASGNTVMSVDSGGFLNTQKFETEENTTLFTSIVDTSKTYLFTAVVTDTVGNQMTQYSTVAPGRANFALAASKYGAAFGGIPKGTMENPMLESYYPAYFYSNIYGSFPGVNTYSEEEVFTGGTWIDGKKIYRKVLTGDVTASTSSNTSLGIVSGIKDIIRMDAMFARSSDGNNYIHPMPYYNSATRYFVPFYNPATGDFLVQATYAGTAILIVDYTRLVDDIFSIVIQPQNIVSNTVEGVQFSVNAVGVASYEWQYGSDGVKFYSLAGFDGWTGTNRNTLTLASNANINWFYRCKLTGADGTEMYTNVVRIIPSSAGITITTQPTDIEANAGDAVTFSVTATGVSSYQWQVGGTNGANWTDLTWEGANTASMTHAMNATNITYVYRCKLTSADEFVLYTNTIRFV